jgi:hypothetical protein
MHMIVLLAGVEACLLVLMVRKIRYNEQLLAEIKRCQFDLAMAMKSASRGRYDEAYNAAMGWARRVRFLRTMKRGEAYRPVPWDDALDQGHRLH